MRVRDALVSIELPASMLVSHRTVGRDADDVRPASREVVLKTQKFSHGPIAQLARAQP